MDPRILVCDIKTTGDLKDGGSIVEIAAYELDTETGEITQAFNSLCREKRLTAKHRDAWIFVSGNLDPAEVRSGPAFETVVWEFQRVVNKYPTGITAYNRAVVLGFLSDRGVRFPNVLPCPMVLSSDVLKLQGSYGAGKWPRLVEAFKYFFPDINTGRRRADNDAFLITTIVYKLLCKGIFKI